jgi:two-component system response regulator YesN
MFKLLLVDDKKDIVQGIASAVDWKRKGVEVNCFYNGRDALDFIKKDEPNMVITDICMPFMSGLEIVKEATKTNPNIKFYVLSGYDEFSYAKEALHLGVVEYLSKPIRIEVIEELVTKEMERLERLKQEYNTSNSIRIKYNQSLPILRSNWFCEFMNSNHPIDDAKLKEMFNLLKIDLNLEDFVVVLIEQDRVLGKEELELEYDDKLILYVIDNISKESIRKIRKCEAFQCDGNRLALIINYDSAKNSIINHYELYPLLSDIQQKLFDYFKIDISIGIGDFYKSPDKIIKSYQEATEALSNKFYFGNSSIISISDISREKEKPGGVYPKEVEGKIIECIKQGKPDNINESISQYFSEIKKMKYVSPKVLKEHIIKFILKICNECTDYSNVHIMEIIEENQKLTTINDMQQWFVDYAKFVSEELNSENVNIKNDILKVKKYIDLHYDENISLKKMADYIFISQSYLSFTFKEIININFNEYLTNVRIQKAKELLRSSKYKVYEVCEMVGYSDKKYFSELFKKYTGVLPKDW